jgi:aminomethyltransferase
MNILAPQPRPRLREPGLPVFMPGVERHLVRGLGAVVLHLFAGDRVAVTDREGRQRCEIAAFAPDGREDLAALGLKSAVLSAGINALLGGRDEASRAIAGQLRQRNLPKGIERSAALFDKDSVAGETVELVAERECIAIFHAAGAPMAVDRHDPPTDLALVVTRRNAMPLVEPPLPEPLGDVREEIRVPRGTATAYTVKAGEYLQVIDVAGRQCSDFLCFDARLLEKGIERGFDMTATRTLTGTVYPGPGLYSKFFTTDLLPLVEVVQDTVGRHDAFGVACTAKFYEDAGYPGHASCSENFNAGLAPYGVQAKRGWPCINFFYNTGLTANYAIFLDDPWSRPGDYVLLRAMTDLVCGSSACPDDIDATNAWNPTDIHLRIYRANQEFSRAIAYRMKPDAEPRLTRETAFHPRTSALTRNFTEYRGFWLPTKFNNHGAVEEYWACREKAVILDLSPLRKFEVLGPDAEQLLQLACTRNIRRLADLQCVYTALLYDNGCMLDDAIVFRMGADKFRVVAGDEFTGQWLRDQAASRGLRVWVKSATDQLHNLSVQGPKSRDILKELVWTPPASPRLDEIQWFHFTIGRLGGPTGTPVIASRTGYTGELGYELFCHPQDAAAVWDAVWEAGQPQGLAPLGLEALDWLRIEAGLIFYRAEFDDQIDPYEAGIGFTVAVKGNEEFIGRAALMKRKEHPQRVLVGLELEGSETATHGNCVHVGRAQVGVVTSACRSPILKKNIALCRLDVNYAALGTEVEVGKLDGHQKRIPARVVRFPFYDPDKTRPRS